MYLTNKPTQLIFFLGYFIQFTKTIDFVIKCGFIMQLTNF